jgi:hypothetical protein
VDFRNFFSQRHQVRTPRVVLELFLSDGTEWMNHSSTVHRQTAWILNRERGWAPRHHLTARAQHDAQDLVE